MKRLLFILLPFTASAQFSAYDPFDTNESGWNEMNSDSAQVHVKDGHLDVNINYGVDFIDAKGADIDSSKEFRSEITVNYRTGDPKIPFGMCYGASDMNNYHLFWINAQGEFGFKSLINNAWLVIIPPTPCPFISDTGTNWLRINVVKENGVLKTHLCINEFLVRSIDHVMPYGNYYGIYAGGKQHIRFDDFNVYQRGKTQEEAEPCDLILSLKCASGQLYYHSSAEKWGSCISNGIRVDEDSTVTRFWYSDRRCMDYSVITVPMTSLGNVAFEKAAQQDFNDYMALGGDIIPLKKESPVKTKLANGSELITIGESYTATGLTNDLYIRRYYVNRPFGDNVGMVYQFIVPVNSKYISTLDLMVKELLNSFDTP